MNSGGELSPAANNGEAPAAVAPYRECGIGKDDDEEEEDEGDGEYGDSGDEGSEARLTSEGVTQSAGGMLPFSAASLSSSGSTSSMTVRPMASSSAWALRRATCLAMTTCRLAISLHRSQTQSTYGQNRLWPRSNTILLWFLQRAQLGVRPDGVLVAGAAAAAELVEPAAAAPPLRGCLLAPLTELPPPPLPPPGLSAMIKFSSCRTITGITTAAAQLT